MRHSTLGISWLHGRLHAAASDTAGQPTAWQCPNAVLAGEALREAIGQAIRHTGFRGKRIAFVVDHRSVLFHVQDTPPARGRILDQVIDRLVAEQRFFAEPAVWCRQPLLGQGQRERSVLCLMPRSLFQMVDEAALSHGLSLTGVHPVASLLASGLRDTGPSTSDRLLMVADLGDSHTLVYGDGTGHVLFARSVTDTHEPSGARLEQEVNRTRFFIQQQFGTPVARVKAVTPGSRSDSAPDSDLAPSGVTGTEPAGLFLARQLVARSDRAPFNFALRHRRPPRWIRPAVVGGMVLSLAASLVVAISVELAVADKARERARVSELSRAEAQAEFLRESVHREGLKLAAHLQTTGASDDPSVPALFPRYLQHRLPPEFRLTTLEIHPATNGWKIHLEGETREQGSRFLGTVESFEGDLSRGPFGVVITDSTHRRTIDPNAKRPETRFPGRMRIAEGPSEQSFFVTGVIQ